MFCQVCSFYESDSTMIEYSCGHSFHRQCLLPNNMSLIRPKCKVCEEGVHMSEYKSDGYYCNDCDDDDGNNSGEKAPRTRQRSRADSWDDIDIWEEVSEYHDISGGCVFVLAALTFVAFVLLAMS